MSLDAAAIARIIDAVEAGKFPDIDKAELRSDLEYARIFFDDITILGNKTHGRELSRKVKLIRKSAQQIMDKMDPEVCRWLDSTDAVLHGRWLETTQNIQWAVQNLINLIDYKPPRNSPTSTHSARVGWPPGSPFARITGWYLRKVFERHFKIEAGYTTDSDNEVWGAYVDFVERALIELGIFK